MKNNKCQVLNETVYQTNIWYKITSMPLTEKRKIGDIGEELASMFLVKHGFKVIERNYQKKWGELDIITTKNNLLYFIEVKTIDVSRETSDKRVTRETSQRLKDWQMIHFSHETNGSRETSINNDEHEPEENVHYWKQKRLSRAIQTYLMERRVSENQEWQIDIITVKLDFLEKRAIIERIDDVVFEM